MRQTLSDPRTRQLSICALSLLLLPLAITGGCNKGQAAPAAPPPAAVTVAHPIEREVIEWDEYSGHLESPETVNVAARVSGLIVDAPFVEGSLVKKGDLLFAIDDRPFKADLDAKQATVEKDQAQVSLARTNFQRTEQALQGNAISQQEYDTAKAQLQQAEAVLAGDKAAAEQSRLNLEWCRVTAPIAGRVSNKLVTPGNLVNGGAGQATLLTTITSLDPMYCYVDVDEQSVLKYQQLSREKKRVSARDTRIPCFLQLGNETNFPHEGVIDFVDNHFDPATGTLRARGVFPNPTGYLTSGMYARLRVPGSGRYRTILISDVAIGTDQNIRYVLLVGPDDVVQSRPVTLGPLFGGLRAIEQGLSVDDEVVINGLLRARPGVKVAPQWTTLSINEGMLTAPGSPTTQDLPATRSIPSTIPTTPDAAAAELNATSRPTTQPAATEGAVK